MEKLTTDKERLTVEDIQEIIKDYEADRVPLYKKLKDYSVGKNPTIRNKQRTDPNNPDNRTPVSYGKKIITTFTGYAYRPRYITYKSDTNPQYLDALLITFDENNEHIKTNHNGRNTGIYGVSYELMYLDKASPRFAVIDPLQLILLYNQDIEPKKKMAIRFYRRGKGPSGKELWDVIVYYDTTIEYYTMTRTAFNTIDFIVQESSEPNYYGEVPIIAYYLDEGSEGLIEPVVPLIDDYDLLVSDSMNEFDRFSHAYLRLVGMTLKDPATSKTPGALNRALQNLKKSRIFENLRAAEDVSFLTKDIPTEYIQFMTDLVREQIHIQSHVPDLSSGAFKDGLSGVAVQRLMFDFENVVSTAEAGFDLGLGERIRLITLIYKKTGKPAGTFDDIAINHKRNAPLNTQEFATTAKIMNEAGFSMETILDNMPDDMVPDAEEELKRQEDERNKMMPDIENLMTNNIDEEGDENGLS